MNTDKIMAKARELRATCGGCGREAFPERVLAHIFQPQQMDSPQYAVVEFTCGTAGCPTYVPLEVVV